MFNLAAELDAVLEKTPVVYEGEPILLAEIDNVVVERDIWDYVRRVDQLEPLPVERTLLLGPITSYFDRWPLFRTNTKTPADIKRFNSRLFKNYDQIAQFAFSQNDIANSVEEDLDVDIIVLLLIDGLSFTDWMDYPGVRSCLVNGPTLTPIGFQNIIGNPPIAHRLFEKGFCRRMGFSHWDRSNELTNIFFRGFDPSTQMFQVGEFEEVIFALDRMPKEQTYVQILTNGLDAISHRHRGRPPVNAFARHLYDNILLRLVEQLQKMGATALVYATADHGILWKPEPGSSEEFVVLSDKRAKSHRYLKGSYLIPDSKTCFCHGGNFTVLAYPFIFRPLSRLEWGTHGGISFQESVVPFVKLEVI